MNKYLRVQAAAGPDSLYFDLAVSPDSRVVGDHVIFGFQGDIQGTKGISYPFRISREHIVDFGHWFEPNERFGFCGVRNVRVEVGEVFNWTRDGMEETYRIHEIVDLLALNRGLRG